MAKPASYDAYATIGVGVDFGIGVGENVVPCRISYEALADHFESGWIPDDLLEAYAQSHEVIATTAMALYGVAIQSGQTRFTRKNPLIIGTDSL